MAGPKTRSRGGCATCKKRKRKCDETRPACLTCQQRKVACEGYQVTLQWDWGVASRGNLARSIVPVVPRNLGVVAKSSPRSSLGHDVTVDYDTIDHDVAVSHVIVDHDNDANNYSPASDATAHSWDYQSDESHRLFSQFLCSGLHTLYSTTTHSWIKEMMVELSLESPAFFAACVTLELLQDKTCAEKFHLCFERALQIFQAELSEEAGAMWRATLGAGILLCTISIDQGIVWTSNLQCMADLYRLSQDGWPKTWFTDPFLLHLLEVMGVMDLPNLVLGRLTPCLGIWKRLRRAQTTWGGENMGGIEIVTGLPRSLLDILAFSDEPTVEQDLWLWEGVEGSLLQSFHWDAWRFSGILLARRSRQTTASKYYKPALSLSLPTTQHLLWRLVASLDALRLGIEQPENKEMLIANGMFYPYMVASSEFGLLRRHPEWVAALGRIRESCIQSRLSHNAQVADEIVQDAWNRGDETCDIHQAAKLREVELAVF